VAFVGGSFGDRGGQNMIEPAAYGVPTCFGPNTKNFADIVALLLESNAASQLQDPQELETWVDRILLETTKADEMGQNAAKVAASHRGAIQRTWEGIQKFLPAS
jgi:3-deoxy-D-manno-octulosonic-acid transferase